MDCLNPPYHSCTLHYKTERIHVRIDTHAKGGTKLLIPVMVREEVGDIILHVYTINSNDNSMG
jgi:hypothetical protein